MPTSDDQIFREAFNASPIGIAVESFEGQPLFVNSALCGMLGLSEEEMLGKHCVEFSPPEDAAKDWALFEQLRAGSIDHYQIDKRFFRRDGSTVWGRLSISQLKGATPPMVVAMVEDITEKKKAEKALFRYAAIVESSDDATVGLDTNGTITNWNKGAERLFGYSASEAIGENILFLSQADAREDGEGVLKKVWQGEVVRHHETVRRRKDGTRVDISLTVSPIVDVEGQIVGASGIARDITERKRAQEALADMSRKLIEAQEQERTRIGRELHDDINQRLAMLALELEQVQNDPSDVQNRVQRFREELRQISDDVQALSHDLHSSKLEYLGVVAGMKSWCKEFAERQKVEINFTSDVSSVVPFELGVSLFRVLQEALHNAAKHSGVKRIEVRIREDSGEIHLIVSDSGRGFDVEAALHGKGLGLTSMRERVRLANGMILIESKPMGGTTIHVRVPFGSEHSTQRAAG